MEVSSVMVNGWFRSDPGCDQVILLCERLYLKTCQILMFWLVVQVLTSSYGGIEGELLNVVRKLVLAIDVDTDLICNSEGTDCRGGCIKRLVVNQLRAAGFDAAVCKSKWEGSGLVLRGN